MTHHAIVLRSGNELQTSYNHETGLFELTLSVKGVGKGVLLAYRVVDEAAILKAMGESNARADCT